MANKQVYTMKDVARLAGVTQPTVSHVINGTASISKPVADKVLEAIKKLNYRPNELARGLKTNTSRTIGIVTPDITNSYYACIAKEIEILLVKKGYIAFLSNTGYNRESEQALVDKFLRYNVDGVLVLCEFLNRKPLKQLESYDIPVVFLDDEPEDHAGCMISTENEQGGYLAAKHLIDRGRRRIAYLGEKVSLFPLRMRCEGYRMALIESDIPLNKDLMILDNDMVYNFGKGLKYGKGILTKKPDAVFASTDIIAIGFMRACANAGISIPDDIAVMGYDNIPLAALMTPALSTVTQPVEDIAANAVEQLFLQIDKQPYEKYIVLEPHLVIRKTT
ncbi:MAG: LacI family transcriptional regulator [Spirochaetaceae bacterium]|jgi:DNA-binding LacI/PurR family transcriptional regulator|nr:LacI family transcriptional regulator [Spirochaetaceae bacterium]